MRRSEILPRSRRFSHQMRSVTIEGLRATVTGLTPTGQRYQIEICDTVDHPGTALGWYQVLKRNKVARNYQTQAGVEQI